MRLGATLAHLSDAPPYPVAGWARRLAGAGFAHLWAPEIIGRGRLVPDPFVALAVAAGATDGVGLSTGTVQVPLHHRPNWPTGCCRCRRSAGAGSRSG